MAHAHRYHLDFNVLFDFQLVRHSLGWGALPQEDKVAFDFLIRCLSFRQPEPFAITELTYVAFDRRTTYTVTRCVSQH